MHRARCFLLSLACSSLCLGAPAFASIALQTLAGAAPDGTPLAASVLIELTPTGGDFAAGTGTASMRLVVENTSGLVPFGSGGRGNPVLTTLYFNLPAGASARLVGATVGAGGKLFRSGVSRTPVPGQVAGLPQGMDVSGYYELLTGASAGSFGRFTHAVSTNRGIIGGLIDDDVFSGLTRLGDVFSPLAFSGRLELALDLSGLDRRLGTAAAMFGLCSDLRGGGTSSSAAVKFQGVGVGGLDSARLGQPCGATPALPSSWGTLKQRYR